MSIIEDYGEIKQARENLSNKGDIQHPSQHPKLPSWHKYAKCAADKCFELCPGCLSLAKSFAKNLAPAPQEDKR